MRKLIIVFCAITLYFIGDSSAQNYDTLQTYPFVYCYNCPDAMPYYHGSTLCDIEETSVMLWFRSHSSRFALYQHTDTPLNVTGIAFSCDGMVYNPDSLLAELSVYDSDMNVLMRGMTKCIPFDSTFVTAIADTVTYKRLAFPGMTHNTGDHSAGGWFDFDVILKMYYFDAKKTLEINGDYWIGIAYYYVPTSFIRPGSVYSIGEFHDPPYRINNVRYRIFENGVWLEDTTAGAIPELFLIVEPECHGVEGVTVTMDTAGCVDVTWDSLDGQTQWRVYLQGPGVSVTDTVGQSHWRYCYLDPNAAYTVSVCARCPSPRGVVWSDWSPAVQFGGTHQGIAEVDNARLGVDLTPNPASGEVTVRCSERITLLELFNAAGDKVFSQQLSTFNFQFSTYTFPAGTYLVLITTEQGVATRKLVVR